MNTRRRGNKWENEIANVLEAHGYTVTTSRQSRGLFDLSAKPTLSCKGGDMLDIQARNTKSGWASRAERKKMVASFFNIQLHLREYSKIQIWRRIPAGTGKIRGVRIQWWGDGSNEWAEVDFLNELWGKRLIENAKGKK